MYGDVRSAEGAQRGHAYTSLELQTGVRRRGLDEWPVRLDFIFQILVIQGRKWLLWPLSGKTALDAIYSLVFVASL